MLLTLNQQLQKTCTTVGDTKNTTVSIAMCTFKVHKNHMTLVSAIFSTLTTMYSTNTSNQRKLRLVNKHVIALTDSTPSDVISFLPKNECIKMCMKYIM